MREVNKFVKRFIAIVIVFTLFFSLNVKADEVNEATELMKENEEQEILLAANEESGDKLEDDERDPVTPNLSEQEPVVTTPTINVEDDAVSLNDTEVENKEETPPVIEEVINEGNEEEPTIPQETNEPVVDNEPTTDEVVPPVTDNNDDDVYKVYFSYSGYEVNILGEETVLVSNLLRTLNINVDLDNIENVVFENNDLLKITKMVNGDWAIQSLSPFDSFEKLYVYTKDGIKYEIRVTDPPVAPQHDKTLTPNGETVTDENGNETFQPDGTYELSLTVTGDATPTQQVEGSVNVLIVYDSSSSMEHWYAVSETGSYGNSVPFPDYNDTNYYKLYSKENDTYTELGIDSTYTGVVYRRSNNTYVEYTPWRTYNSGNYGRDSAPANQYDSDGYFQLYKLVDGSYEKIQAGDSANTVYRYNETTNTYTQYTGTRYANYLRYSAPRANAAEKAIREFVDSLTAYNETNTSTNVQIAFVTFSDYTNNNTKVLQTWTNNKNDEISNLLSNSLNSKELSYHSGTNYEKALTVALGTGALASADGDQTFVIFMTDGQPSQSLTQTSDGHSASTINPYGNTHEGRYVLYNQVLDEIQQVANYNTANHNSTSSTSNTTLFGIYAFGKEDDVLDDLIYYANNGTERDNVTYETDYTGVEDYYFNASNTQQLNTAISKIFKRIADALGISSVSIADGTTSSVKLTQEADEGLLVVDDTSFEYYLSWTVTEDEENDCYTFDMLNPYDRAVVTYYAENTDDGVVIKTDLEEAGFTVKGAITEVTETVGGTSVVKNVLKLLWGRSGNTETENLDISNLEANNFYYRSPKATFGPDSNGNDVVGWDLNSLGTLLSGVTYEITFDVWPSQTTLDLIADIKNDPTIYDSLSSTVKQYLNQSGQLSTNTTAKLYFSDTRLPEDDRDGESTYVNPDPVPTTLTEMVTITKKWVNNLDDQEGNKPITITIIRDNETKAWNTITLPKLELVVDEEGNPVLDPETGEETYKNVFYDKKYVAVGIMTVHDGVVTLKTTGHDYSFGEIADDSYYWELKSDTIRPMLINNKLTMLYKDVAVDENGACPNDETTYYIINGYCYRDGGNNAGNVALTAINERRSYFDLTKLVDYNGEDSPYPNEIFYFDINVTDKENKDVWFAVKYTDNPDLEDYVYEKDGLVVTGATLEVKNLECTNPNITELSYNSETGMISYKYKDKSYEVLYADEYTNYIYKESEDSEETKVLDSTIVTNIVYNEEDGTITYTDKDGVEHTVYYVGVTGKNYKYYTGFYSATSGSTFRVGMKEGWNLRVINLLTGSSYTINEVNLDSKYELSYIADKNETDEDGNLIPLTVVDEETEEETQITRVDDEIVNTNKAYGYVFVNKIKKINIPVEKVWTVSTDTTEVTITLMNGEDEVDSVTLDGTEETPWTYTFADLDAYDANGDPITYSIKEVSITGYRSEITGNIEDGFVITNTPIIEVPVEKRWSTGSAETEVTIKLMIGEEEVASITLDGNEETPWKHIFTNLDKYDSEGNPITYTVSETLAGYSTAITGSMTGYVVTNTELTSVPVEKQWSLGSAKTTVTIKLMNGETQVSSVTLDGSEETPWKYTFTNLNKYDTEGKAITYTVAETLAGYSTTITGSMTGYVVTNKELTEVPVEKQWSLGSTEKEVTINLMNGETVVASVKLDGTTDELETTAWKYTFTNLDKYDSQGKAITYTVAETLAGYSTTITGSMAGYVVTNKELTEVPVEKKWSKNSATKEVTINLMNGETLVASVKLDGTTDELETTAWKYTFTNLDKYDSQGKAITYTVAETLAGYSTTIAQDANGVYVVTNTELTEVPVEKQWSKNSATKEVTINLMNGETVVASVKLDGTTDELETTAWKYTFTNLNKYDANGDPIAYTVSESLAGYSTAITGSMTGYVVTNTELTEVPVEKKWSTGSAETTVTIKLMNGETQVSSITLDGSEETPWKYTFTNLDKYNESGDPINYTVSETLVGYSTTITGSMTGYVVTNTELTEVPVEKQWSLGSEEQEVTIRLMIGEEEVASITLDGSEETPWTYIFTNLNKCDEEGNAITYTVAEELEGYRTDITGSMAGYVVTNTELTEVPVEKQWSKGSTEKEVTIRLMIDEEEVASITLDGSEETPWTYVFTDLDKYDSEGNAITYTVAEELAGYSTEITGSMEGYIVINTELTEVPVEKKWISGGETETITIRLMIGEEEVASIELDGSEETPWKYTFTNLDKYNSDGEEIEYSITEDEVKGYRSVVEGFVVTNIKLVDATIIKVWDDKDNQDNIRPTSLTVQLLANDKEVADGTITLEENEEGIWTGTITDLDKYSEDGSEIAYTWKELDLPEGYELTDTSVDGMVTTLTNTHEIEEPELIDITITKVWSDFDNQDGVRPAEITIRLKGNGKEVKVITLSEETGWDITITDLPKYDEDGKVIEYVVTEDPIELYEAVITGDAENGFRIENFYSPKGGDNPPPTPQTGDSIILSIITLILSLVGFGYSFYLKKKYN